MAITLQSSEELRAEINRLTEQLRAKKRLLKLVEAFELAERTSGQNPAVTMPIGQVREALIQTAQTAAATAGNGTLGPAMKTL